MAHMYPEALVRNAVRSNAEFDLYHALSQQLSKDFYVFHSVAWLGIRQQGEKPSDGETDFIIAHPRMGVLLIEVKGGLVGVDGETGWYTIRSDKTRVGIKDPIEQVKKNKYALLRKISSLPNWPGRTPTLGHAVAFPDGTVDLPDLGMDAPRDIIMFHENMEDLDGWVRNCLKFWAGDQFVPPGEGGVLALRDLLARTWLLREPRLAEIFGPEAAAIERYTEEQFELLDFIAGRPRAAIRGCAGSGKTTLAIRKARQLASEGFRTLLTCYNRNLAKELSESSGLPIRLKVRSFHGLCQEYANRTGFNKNNRWNDKNPEFFDEIMPEALIEAAAREKNEYRFDAIIVDEGQDFNDNWWAALEELLADQKEGLFYIFYDDNQLVYNRRLKLPVLEAPFALTINCRNTQSIHKAVVQFYRSDLKLKSRGPDGRPIGIRSYRDATVDLRAALTEVLTELVFSQEIRPEDIVVLSPRGLEKPPLSEIKPPGIFRLVTDAPKSPEQILCTTIRLFKGMERPVVILVVPDDDGNFDELMYVGLSRARHHLEIMVEESCYPEMLAKFHP